jgi:hypothetical protein
MNKWYKQKENDGILLYAETEKHKKGARTVQINRKVSDKKKRRRMGCN